ncbi:MAG TPA: TIGR03986 family CRISPR-associated RAMP protein, partial [bacterium]|nr:TIGR03986 family CRISPR-associated RAMP protein [bacterium]
PKPTSFQLYLEQKDPAFLNHYNTGANIRGYKLYWHKTGKNYIETDEKKIKEHPSQYTKIKPLKQGARFSGRIRFENLTDTELGALLFVLRLKENLFHKIGMGKPLGLGTLRISPRLFLSERKKRYSEFLFEFSGCAENAEKIEYYALLFDKYVRETLGMSENSLWDVPRIRELRCMLDFSKKPSDEKTCYMRIEPDNEFKSRDILPRPCDVQKT